MAQGTLCPHQDYIYFNYPTVQECQLLAEFSVKAENAIERIIKDSRFSALVYAPLWTNDEFLFDHIKGSIALLCCLEKAGNTIDTLLINKLTARKKLPRFERQFAELAFQMILDFPDGFDPEVIAFVRHELAASGLLIRRHVSLCTTKQLGKMLASSLGKLESISAIVSEEYGQQRDAMRMLILTDFIKSGEYDKNRSFYTTVSPSMDILVSSNLERLLYHASNCNAEKVAGYMEQLNTEGIYEVDREALRKIRSEFFGAWVDEIETKETIARVYKECDYVMDTHTAVAWRALEKYRYLPDVDNTYSVVLSTASPYKFADSVLSAIKEENVEVGNVFDLLRELQAETGMEIPSRMLALENAEIIHKEVISAANMELTVISNLE